MWRIYDVRGKRIWLLVSIGFAYLALDEALSIHESIDIAGHWLLGATETGVTDRVDDLIPVRAARCAAGRWRTRQCRHGQAERRRDPSGNAKWH